MALQSTARRPIPAAGHLRVNGIKVKDLAAAVGVTAEYMSAVLNGHRSPSKPLQLAIAHVLEAPEADLFESAAS